MRRALIRRVTFDLTGLPPTPDDVAAFVADRSSDAFAKVVDRLLASPHYGERQARHWLDLARYADGNLGASKDTPEESLFLLRHALTNLLEVTGGVTRLPRVPFRLFYATLSVAHREVAQSALWATHQAFARWTEKRQRAIFIRTRLSPSSSTGASTSM